MWRIQKVFNIGPGPDDDIPGTFDDEHINDGWVMSTHPAELPGHFNQADVDQYFVDRPADFFESVLTFPTLVQPIQPDQPTPPVQPIRPEQILFCLRSLLTGCLGYDP